MKFPTKDFFSKWDQIRADLVTFTEGALNGKLHFFVQCVIRLKMSKKNSIETELNVNIYFVLKRA